MITKALRKSVVVIVNGRPLASVRESVDHSLEPSSQIPSKLATIEGYKIIKV